MPFSWEAKQCVRPPARLFAARRLQVTQNVPNFPDLFPQGLALFKAHFVRLAGAATIGERALVWSIHG
jgi:hypothetical protein